MLEKQIEDFWNWFCANQPLIETVIDNQEHPKTETIVQALNQHILGMGKLKWEMGNPSIGIFAFTFSPNSDRELLKITKTVVAAAPSIRGWSFFHALQPTGASALQMYDGNMDIQEIDANAWRVVTEKDPSGRFDLLLEAENIMHLDEDTQTVAVDLILNALLGEEEKIKQLAGFDLVESLDDSEEIHALSILNLSSFLKNR